VASRVEENPDSLLRLYRRQRSAGADGVLDRRVEIADPNIKVLGGVLLAGLARPSRRRPLLLVLEVKRRPALPSVDRIWAQPAVGESPAGDHPPQSQADRVGERKKRPKTVDPAP
jgi:hypothetical protein